MLAFVPLIASDDSWINMFDGKTLEGWKADTNPGQCEVQKQVAYHVEAG